MHHDLSLLVAEPHLLHPCPPRKTDERRGWLCKETLFIVGWGERDGAGGGSPRTGPWDLAYPSLRTIGRENGGGGLTGLGGVPMIPGAWVGSLLSSICFCSISLPRARQSGQPPGSGGQARECPHLLARALQARAPRQQSPADLGQGLGMSL